MSYNLCIFDLDGTLTDPKLGITKSFQYALAYFDIHVELDELTKFIGPPLREAFRDYLLRGLYTFREFSEDDTEIAVAKYREYLADYGIYENEIYPNILELLESLKSLGLTLAVATNKATYFAVKTLEHFDLDKYFSIISGDELDGSLTTHGKRDIIKIVLDNLDPNKNLSPVMIGDRLNDIYGARDAGIDSIGVTWGYGSREELEQAGATHIIDTPKELEQYLLSN